MSRIDRAFAALRSSDRKGFIPYLTAGYPTPDVFADLLRGAADAGSSIIEIGVPFSDPIADGPIIQASSEAALRLGMTLPRVLGSVRAFRKTHDTPLVLMGYANPFFKYGFGRFVSDAADAGADGVIVPDLPPEEAGELIGAARDRDLSTIFLVSTTSTEERIRRIGDASTGYVYCVSRLGVTGVGSAPSDSVGDTIARIRAHTALPIAAGFGIATPEDARRVCEHADAAIVGSALVKLIAANAGRPNLSQLVCDFCSSMAAACAGDAAQI